MMMMLILIKMIMMMIMMMMMMMMMIPTTSMSLLKNLSINYLKTNFTILCLYSSEADEMAMSQLFCILDTFAGFKRQNLYTR